MSIRKPPAKHAAGPISYFLSIPEYGPGEEGAVKIAHQLSESGRGSGVHILLPPRFGPDGADFDDYLQEGWLGLTPPMVWVQWAAREFAACNGNLDRALDIGWATWVLELVATETLRPDPLYAQLADYASSFTIRTTQGHPVICDTSVDADDYPEYRDETRRDPPGL